MSLGARHKISATTLVALWIVMPMLAAVHLAVEEHAYCVEHGALEDVADTDGPHVDFEDDDSARARPGGQEPASPHEACAFEDCAIRDVEIVELVQMAAIVPVVHGPMVLLASSHVGNPVPLLLTAPKISPPFAA